MRVLGYAYIPCKGYCVPIYDRKLFERLKKSGHVFEEVE